MLNEGKSRQVLLSVLGVAILVVAVVGISFALFTNTDVTGENSINLGTIVMTYSEKTPGLAITDAMPTANDDGEDSANYFDFEVTGNASRANVKFNYTVSITEVSGNTLDPNDVVLYLTDGAAGTETAITGFEEYPLASSFTTAVEGRNDTFELLRDSITVGTANQVVTKTYRLRMWVKETATMESGEVQTYKILVNVDGTAAPLDVQP